MNPGSTPYTRMHTAASKTAAKQSQEEKLFDKGRHIPAPAPAPAPGVVAEAQCTTNYCTACIYLFTLASPPTHTDSIERSALHVTLDERYPDLNELFP